MSTTESDYLLIETSGFSITTFYIPPWVPALGGIAFRRSLEVWRSQGAAFFSAPRSLRIALVRTFSTPGSTSEAMALAS